MTPEQEERVEECMALLAQVGLTIETLIEIDSEGEKIGLPFPPRPKK